MSDSLPKRLRSLADEIDKAMMCDMPFDDAMMREAADEIERLKEERAYWRREHDLVVAMYKERNGA